MIGGKFMVFRSVLIWIIGLNLLIGQNELAGEFQNGICDSFTHHKNQQLCARIVQRKLQTYPTSFTPAFSTCCSDIDDFGHRHAHAHGHVNNSSLTMYIY
jgi:hypothetical protein